MSSWQFKQAFAAGEISPLLHARDDRDWYAKACKQLENFLIMPQGPLVRRPGTQFIWDLSTTFAYDCDFKVIPFIFSETAAYAIIIVSDKALTQHTKIVFAYGDGLVPDPGNSSIPYIIDTAEHQSALLFDYAQSYDYLILVHPAIVPKQLVRISHAHWHFESVTFTNNSFTLTDATYYPTVVSFHDQRLALAGASRTPATVQLSKAGDIFNFATPGATVLDDDRVTFTLASGKQNKIVWMVSGDGLLLGTLGDEWRVTGNDGGPITPSSILAKKQTSKGSVKRKTLLAGGTCFFLERHGHVVNSFTYNVNDNGFQTSDMRILAEHLTRDVTISDWTYQQSPSSIVWCALSDGTLAGLTYEKEHKITGWHRHDLGGDVLALTAIPGTGTDRLWVVVQRDSRHYLELMDVITVPDTTTEVVHLDSYLTYSGVAKTVFTGLGHLEGLEVQILADGAIHPNKTVASGAIELNYASGEVVIGLGYTSTVEPLIDNVSLTDGTSKGRIQRISSASINILNSLLFEYGPDESDMELETFRTASDPTGVVETLFSGERRVVWQGDYEVTPRIILRQSRPFPFTILGIVNKVEVYS